MATPQAASPGPVRSAASSLPPASTAADTTVPPSPLDTLGSRHVVITGATGLIGRQLVAALAATPATVTVLARSPGAARASFPAATHPRVAVVAYDAATATAPAASVARAVSAAAARGGGGGGGGGGGAGPPGDWRAAVAAADVVLNFAGEPIDGGRWTAARKATLTAGRVGGTAAVGAVLAAAAAADARRDVAAAGGGATAAPPPRRERVLVSASAVGYYGAVEGDVGLTEASPPGRDFLAGLAAAWEAAALSVAGAPTAPNNSSGGGGPPAAETAAQTSARRRAARTRAVGGGDDDDDGGGGGGGGGVGVRVVVLRLGVVLSADGGALAKMLPVFQRYAGGAPGGGGCWFSWVSLADVVAVTLTAAAGTPPGASSAAAGSGAAGGPCRWSGVYNVVAPGVVTLASFCAALGAALGRPVWMPVPGGVMRALMGEAAMLVLAGQKVLPSRLSRRGYVWREGELGGGAMRKGDEGRKAAEEEGGAGGWRGV
ncbi:hypothetical protein I4F81_008679 [Pyropia yezoensis]|uniref:Uncharacterized protein n=1 Tax=Pyropia yezoensis TaxID=2788 RepID=A0ACC3C7P6_PYRYE|nr:hypothetical protein I4F81_008679 [Neopyropia yezoensis]